MNNNKAIIIIIVLAVIFLAGYYYMTKNESSVEREENKTQTQTTNASKNPVAVIETIQGVIKVELRSADAPKTVQNFIDLSDRKFYDGLKFHRVVPGFVSQGGDPKGDGTGGSGANIPLEIKCVDGTIMEGQTIACSAVALTHKDGALAMARSQDPNSASSQFYITNGEQKFLDGNYAVFGYVTEGMDTVRKIQMGDTITRIHIEK